MAAGAADASGFVAQGRGGGGIKESPEANGQQKTAPEKNGDDVLNKMGHLVVSSGILLPV